MKRPDRDTIRRVLDERATPQEAREVARWFSSAEGAAELSRLIDEEARMLETGFPPKRFTAASVRRWSGAAAGALRCVSLRC